MIAPTTVALLRDARASGQIDAALDRVISLGYDRERAERACRPYVPPSNAYSSMAAQIDRWVDGLRDAANLRDALRAALQDRELMRERMMGLAASLRVAHRASDQYGAEHGWPYACGMMCGEIHFAACVIEAACETYLAPAQPDPDPAVVREGWCHGCGVHTMIDEDHRCATCAR